MNSGGLIEAVKICWPAALFVFAFPPVNSGGLIEAATAPRLGRPR